MSYQDKLKDDYEEVIKEYVIDFTGSVNITHNQDDTLTSVGQRVGVVILENVTPDRIRVSSSDTDLVFFDEVSNHVINIKNWNNSESYRISTLEFDSGLEPIIIRRLDKFSLSNVAEIQNLINKASEICQKRAELELNKQLLAAARDGDFNKVKDLVSRCATLDTQDRQGWTPILLAAEAGKWSIVKFLLDNGANIDNETTYQGTPLHYAVQEGNLDIAEFLLDRGADIESQNYYNQKPLHIAVQAGRLNVVNLLLDRGANIKATDMYSQTPLDLATQKDYKEVIEVLKQKQLDLNKELLIAAGKGNLEKVKDNVRQGASIDAKYNTGRTPLHWAARNGHLSIVQYLIEKGANFSIKDNDGKTPLDLASWKRHDTVVQYLNRIKGENKKPTQRKRRHNHGDYNRYRSRLSRKPLAIDLSNQPEIAASSSTRPSSWLNSLFGWVKAKSSLLTTNIVNPIGRWFIDSKDINVSNKNESYNSVAQGDLKTVDFSQVDVNSTLFLLDVFIRRITGQKYISTVDQSISPLEALGYALNITEGFKRLLNETATKSGISVKNLNFDPVAVQSAIVRQIVSEKFSKISKTLYSFAKEACPEFQQTDKFLVHLRNNLKGEKEAVLLQQKVEQTSDQQISRKVVAKELPKKPDTFLNGTSVVKGISSVLER
ncbi:Phosphocholine transferase AnkX [Wolbachia endosymbiont of Cylisticus convexus]|nr:Phosphocholine transferase AnkX [Wolbachia endosymbiont of Cylisticus convexus]